MNIPEFFTPIKNITAKVIWPSEQPRDFDIYAMFRKKFTITAEKCSVRIFANTYYNLYVDGSFVHRGPIRRRETNAEIDILDFDLSVGEHTVAVLVHHIGRECAGHRKGDRSFWCEIITENEKICSDSSWKAIFCDSFDSDGGIFSHYDFRENIDMRTFPVGWETCDFDDSAWDNAKVLYSAADENDVHKNYTARKMKLFSYPTEIGCCLKDGRYTEKVSADDAYFMRQEGRDRSDSGVDGNYFVVGFDATISGTVELYYKNAVDGDEIIIGYDDMLDDDGMPQPRRIMNYSDRFVVPEGKGSVQIFMPRGFRYLLIDASNNCEIEKVVAVKEVYPYEAASGFSAGDSYYTRLFGQSVKTQQVCTIDGFTDCVNRERVLWLGDAYLDCLGAYYSTADRNLLLTTLYEHALAQNEKGGLGGYNSSDLTPEWLYMMSYNLMFVHMVCDYILYTGREEDVLPLKDTVMKIIGFVLDNMNDRGVFDTTVNDCSNYWDWGYAEPGGESLKTNAYLIYTVERMAQMDFFKDVLSEKLLNDMAELKLKCREIFYDESRGVFLDGGKRETGLDPLSTQGANSYAVISGVCEDSYSKELLLKITDDENLDEVPIGENQGLSQFTPNKEKILPAGTMYGATIVCRALFEKGLHERAMEYILDVWGPFDGEPTLPELRRNGGNNTMCHGWSGAPAFLLPMYVLGLRPETNGWKTAIFEPVDVSEETLCEANGTVETPYGRLSAQWTRCDGFMKASVVLPEGITMKIRFKGKEILFAEKGEHCIYIPCK